MGLFGVFMSERSRVSVEGVVEEWVVVVEVVCASYVESLNPVGNSV